MPRPAPRLAVLLVTLALAQLAAADAAVAGGRTLVLAPGASLQAALLDARPGDTVELLDGVHPRQVVTRRPAGPVTVRGRTRDGAVVEGLELRGDAADLVFRDLTVRTRGPDDPEGAIKVFGGVSGIVLERLVVQPRSHGGLSVHNWGGAPRGVVLRDSVVDGSRSSGTWRARAVYVGDVVGAGPDGWPSGIRVEGNDLHGFWADGIHVAGATDMAVVGNRIRDLQDTEDHNDGIQSVASLRLRIVGNEISSPATPGTTGIPPDQGIILGHAVPARPHLRVVDTVVADNVITGWRGRPLLVHGTDRTRIVHNTAVRSGPAADRYASPSLTVSGPAGGPANTDLRVWNNVLDRVWVDAAVPPAHRTANCVRLGAVAGEVAADPRLAGTPADGLAADSPCRGIGVQPAGWGTPLVDRLGTPRPPGPDAGAWQHPAAPSTDPPGCARVSAVVVEGPGLPAGPARTAAVGCG